MTLTATTLQATTLLEIAGALAALSAALVAGIRLPAPRPVPVRVRRRR